MEFPQPPTGLLVLTCSQVVLQGLPVQPATIVVDRLTGKIKDVLAGELLGEEEVGDRYSALGGEKDNVEWIRVEEGKVLVPGLVE